MNDVLIYITLEFCDHLQFKFNGTEGHAKNTHEFSLSTTYRQVGSASTSNIIRGFAGFLLTSPTQFPPVVV